MGDKLDRRRKVLEQLSIYSGIDIKPSGKAARQISGRNVQRREWAIGLSVDEIYFDKAVFDFSAGATRALSSATSKMTVARF